MFVSPSNWHVETLSPNVIILRDGAFGKDLEIMQIKFLINNSFCNLYHMNIWQFRCLVAWDFLICNKLHRLWGIVFVKLGCCLYFHPVIFGILKHQKHSAKWDTEHGESNCSLGIMCSVYQSQFKVHFSHAIGRMLSEGIMRVAWRDVHALKCKGHARRDLKTARRFIDPRVHFQLISVLFWYPKQRHLNESQ